MENGKSELDNAVSNPEFQKRLLHSEKLAAIGQITAGVAHEINNPIGYIGSNLNALQDYANALIELVEKQQALLLQTEWGQLNRGQIEALSETAEFSYIRDDLPVLLRESQEGVERIRRTVQDLKDFSRTSDIASEWVDIHNVLRSALNIVHHELKHIAIVREDFQPLPTVYCSPSQLSQVFVNILINAAQALDQTAEGVIEVGTRQQGDWVEVFIRDNGPGIPEQEQERLFEPFYSTKPAGAGTGLGLSISANIVADHHGTLTMESNPGHGACFRIKIPIDRDTA